MTEAPEQLIKWIRLYSTPSNSAIPNDFLISGNQVNPTYITSKQDVLVSGTNIKTINNSSILGSGNITLDSWNKTGNAGTNLSTDFIGTTDNQDLAFKRNNVELLRLKAVSTNVPILNIKTTSGNLSTSPLNGMYLKLGEYEYLVNSYRLIGFGYAGSGAAAYFGYQEKSVSGNTFGDLVWGTQNIGGIPSERMRLFGNGNLAIGSVSDGGKVYIRAQGALSTDNVLRIRNSEDNADILNVTGNGVLKAQKINISAIPTSSAGLVAGDVWNDVGTLKII